MVTDGLITARDVLAAHARLRRYLSPSPLRRCDWLSDSCGADVALKLESVQVTNSFKIRGALNALQRLAEAGETRAVTASAGNHGRAMAFAGRRLGVAVTVFTPASAPETKKRAIQGLGADLRDRAEDYDAAETQARDHAAKTGSPFISPYNHPDVIAGAGTVALEILEATPDVEVVMVPVGGGGLISGIATVVKHAAPHVRVVGVEAQASQPFAAALAAGEIRPIDVGASIADGLVGNLERGAMTFEYVRRYVHALVSVTEDALEQAIHGLAEHEHLIVEGAGAAATAAVLGCAAVPAGARAVVLVTGGNIDVETFAEVLHRRGGSASRGGTGGS
jgi:threonine dehydratase